MAQGSVEFEVRANTSKLDGDLKKAKSSVGSVAGSIASGVGKTLLGVTAAVGTAALALGTYAVKVGSDFEAAMSGVATVAGYSVAELADETSQASIEFNQLRDAALEAGRTTVFTAIESADALQLIGLAGFDAAESIELLPSVLTLAAASGADLQKSTEILVNSYHALGLEFDNLDTYIDQLTRTSQISATTMEELGDAFVTLGATGQFVAGGTEELSAAFAVLANSGITGSEAGTKLRNVLLSLTSPTDKARNALDELGVSVEDANGNLRPLEQIFGDLQFALEDFGDVARLDVLGTVFNKRDLAAVNQLLNTTTVEWDQLTYEIVNSGGAAADAADQTLNNLQGDLKLLSSQAESTGIAIYDGLQEPLRNATQSVTEFLYEISQNGQLDRFIEVIGKIAEGLVEAFLEILPIAIDLIDEILPILAEVGETVLPALLEAIDLLLPVVADLVKDLLPVLVQLFVDLIPPIIEIIEALLPVLVDLFVELIPVILEIIDAVLPVLIDLFNTLIPPLLEIVTALLPLLLDLFDALWPIIQAVIDVVLPLIEVVFDLIGPLISLIVDALEPIIEIIAFVIDLALIPLMANFESLSGVVETVIAVIVDTLNIFFGTVKEVFGGIIDFITAVFTGDWEGAWDAVVRIFEGIWEGIKDIVKLPINGIIGIINSFIRGINGLKIPDWIPGIGGASPNIPEIPRLKVGMDYVPSDFFPAFLDKGEAVLTAEEADLWRSLGRANGLKALLSSSHAATSSVQQLGVDAAANAQSAMMEQMLQQFLMRDQDQRWTLHVSFDGTTAQLVRMLEPEFELVKELRGEPI